MTEIEHLEKRIKDETPPSGFLYYKYAAEDDDKKEKENTVANRKIINTSDKLKIKIRFSDLPVSKSTVSGLFKAKYIKMTET